MPECGSSSGKKSILMGSEVCLLCLLAPEKKAFVVELGGQRRSVSGGLGT